jgi:lipopolysaccharide biosynthesis protein
VFIQDIDDLVLESDEDAGIEEVGRRVLSRGPWTSIAFLVRTRSAPGGPWEGPFLWLHRYQKVREGWKLVSRFRTTEPGQLELLREFLGS